MKPIRDASQVGIRLHDSNADVIEGALRDRFAAMQVTRTPLAPSYDLRILVTFRPPEDEDIASYDWIHSTGAGVDAICRRLGTTQHPPIVTRTIGTMPKQIGEYCLAYILEDAQRLAQRRSQQARKLWDRTASAPTYCFDKQVAILGTGEIGQGIASTLSSVGIRTIGFSRSGNRATGFDAVHTLDDLNALRHVDAVVSALPATAATDQLLNETVFSQLKHALLINVGRGSTLNEDALLRALDSGCVRRAVLDVFRQEPLPPEHRFWTHDRVTVTPHVSGLTQPTDAASTLCTLLDEVLRVHQLPDSMVTVSLGY
ncbi:NAD(P)-dependent oxidoreductase [Hyphomonas johnsonii]|uniref:D-isomer specific 2-hydroxyacid dehydrogenase NAD-binding protein n=1 Tax=Hyphomonas johnsonii MHS-2 TaxID=1280950 RepID=A0A059FVE9_9PROT|nr:NAD(P)-dependent oxidoreductase [Hyphomonas johnsonii]KCZ94428.1 D-isomer specific 2-hydroxyacid dehydrogenase NAD-binding protein [Hyphomonas johnsonii MHS-2]